MSRIFPRLSPEGRCLECLLTSGSSVLSSTWGIFALDAFECSFPNVWRSFQTSEHIFSIGYDGREGSISDFQAPKVTFSMGRGKKAGDLEGMCPEKIRYVRVWENPVKETNIPFS